MADQMVLKTQQWLNKTFGGKTGYGNNIAEDGITGTGTVNALLRAFQIELGITSTANSFGPTTISKFNARFPNGIEQQSPGNEEESNIYGIIQGALWCKGYYIPSQEITLHFYSGTGDAIKKLKSDAGCSDTTSTVTLNVMKALLSMTYFVCAKNGSEKIRFMQQYLNQNYENYIGLAPCDGLYSRDMNKSLIKAVQVIEGYTSTSDVDGVIGNNTKKYWPTIPYNNTATNKNGELYNTISIQKMTVILAISLYVNGFGDGTFVYSESAVKDFQQSMMLTADGICGLRTWLALLTSCGDTSRSSTACDTIHEITTARISTLKSNGISIVGRYLTNTPGGTLNKKLQEGEAKRIINNDLKLFPIFQQSGNSASYFTENQGKTDIILACDAANSYNIPLRSVIYFAVDFDVTDAQITNYILPYFKGLNEALKSEYNNLYKIGIYAPRNACQRVLNANYAVTSFVSDMSTGFSGNMGFKMPSKWTFDQYANVTIGSGSGSIEIDKDTYNTDSTNLPVSILDRHPVVRNNVSSYYLGTIKNVTHEDIFGNYFTVLSNHLKLSFKLTSTIVDSSLYANVAVFQYDKDKYIGQIPKFQRDKWVPLEIDTVYGADYRIRYSCDTVGTSIDNAIGDIEVYLSTC